MKLNLIGPFQVNAPFGTEIAFSKGLKQLGFVEVTECDPNVDRHLDGMDKTADATIVFKSCVGSEENLNSLSGPVIVYQPDDARFPHIREMMLMMRNYSDLFLAFDRNSVKIARQMGYQVAEELLLTADPDLYCPSPEPIERDIDVSFIGSLGDPIAHASRRKMIEIVQKWADRYKVKTTFAQTQHIPTVLDIYRRSKVVLNHATDVGQPFGYGYGYQCRHFEVGMTRTALLTNGIYQENILEEERPLSYMEMFWTETNLIMKLERMLSDLNQTADMAQAAYDEIREKHMPIHRAGQIVNFVQRHVLG